MKQKPLKMRLLNTIVIISFVAVILCTICFVWMLNNVKTEMLDKGQSITDILIDTVKDGFLQNEGNTQSIVLQYIGLVGTDGKAADRELLLAVKENLDTYDGDGYLATPAVLFIVDNSVVKEILPVDEESEAMYSGMNIDEFTQVMDESFRDYYLPIDEIFSILQEGDFLYNPEIEGVPAIAFAHVGGEKYLALFAPSFLNNNLFDALYGFAAMMHEESAVEIDSVVLKFSIILTIVCLLLLVLILVFARRLSSAVAEPVEREKEILTQINRQKAALLSDISHEIRTPLTVISGYAQSANKQIEEGSADEETIQGLLVVQLEAQRLANLAQQLISAPNPEFDEDFLGAVDPQFLAQHANRLITPILEKNNNQLALLIEDNCPPVYTNADMITQVLMNLCINANRHTQDGKITLEISPAGSKVAFTVADNGDGIDESLLENVFQRGVSGDGGNGLGLSICKEVVESHGGEISITSQKDEGTRVTFTLPIASIE